MKHYQEKEKKDHVLGKFLMQITIIFIVATISIVLYDMYINIDVDNNTYSPEKVSTEISTKNTENISSVLETVSKSVVRNF